MGRIWHLRREDKGLTDELALGVFGDGDSVAAGAGSAANKCAFRGRRPASMANVGELDFAVVGVGSGADEHSETFLECGGLAAGDVVDVKTAIIYELALWASIADLRNAAVTSVSCCWKGRSRCSYM
jgi:hypothetical protein